MKYRMSKQFELHWCENSICLQQQCFLSYIKQDIDIDFDSFSFRNISCKTNSLFFHIKSDIQSKLYFFWFFLCSRPFYSTIFQDKWSVVQYCGTYRWYSIALSQCALSCSSESFDIYAEKFSIHTTNQNRNQIHQMIQHIQINASFILANFYEIKFWFYHSQPCFL